MSAPVLVDLYCGVGGAAMGYNLAGFEIVGVDKEPQPNYPFAFVRGNALTFDLSIADAVHASPPCQRWSPISRHQRVAAKYDDLIAPTREKLRAWGGPWVMENVPEAPLDKDLILCGAMFGLPIIRHRAFEFYRAGLGVFAPAHPRHKAPSQSWSGYNRLPGTLTIVGHTYALREGRKAMEIDWAKSREELNEAIPPAYTQLVGDVLMREVMQAA